MKARILPIVLSLSFASLIGCQQTTDGDIWPLVENCDLHQQTCFSEQAEANVSLTLHPQPIPIAKPIQVEAQIKALDVVKVELDISGINMYMGYNRVPLTADAVQPGLYHGTSMLAFCTNDIMQWQFTLLIHQPNGDVLQVPFKLETRNR